MAGIKLDGAGTQKMKTLEDALATMQQIHGIVERMALDVKNNREAVGQIRTALEIMAAKVKKDHAVEIEISPD